MTSVEMPSQQKREQAFTENVPECLPEDMYLPVSVDCVDIKKKTSQSEIREVLAYDSKRPYHENLNMCLSVLRQVADEQGRGFQMVKTLKSIKDMTQDRAYRATRYLRGMGVYVSKRVSGKKYGYQLNLDITEITEDMLSEYLASQKSGNRSLKSTDRSNDNLVANLPAAVMTIAIDSSNAIVEAERVSDELAVDAVTSQLVDIIEYQKVEISNLQAEISKLKSQLKIDPRVRAVLDEYGTVISK